jgi:hypothetical protein
MLLIGNKMVAKRLYLSGRRVVTLQSDFEIKHLERDWVKNILADLRRFHKNKRAESGEYKRLGDFFFLLITLKWVHLGQTLQMSKHPRSFANHC